MAKVNANVLGLAVNRISYRLAGSHYYYYDYYEDRSGDDSGDGGRSPHGRSRGKEQPPAEPTQPAAAGSFASSRLREVLMIDSLMPAGFPEKPGIWVKSCAEVTG